MLTCTRQRTVSRVHCHAMPCRALPFATALLSLHGFWEACPLRHACICCAGRSKGWGIVEYETPEEVHPGSPPPRRFLRVIRCVRVCDLLHRRHRSAHASSRAALRTWALDPRP